MQAGSGASVGVSIRRRVSRRGQGAMSGEREVEMEAQVRLEEGLRGFLLVEQREESVESPQWMLRLASYPS